MPFEPLRVRAYMDRPAAVSFPLLLDDVVILAAMKDQMGQDFERLPHAQSYCVAITTNGTESPADLDRLQHEPIPSQVTAYASVIRSARAVRVPLDKLTLPSGGWCWWASEAQATGVVGIDHAYMVRRDPSTLYVKEGETPVDRSSGPFHLYLLSLAPIVFRPDGYIEWQVCGDREELARLLNQYIHGLGAKTAYGSNVRHWEVVPAESVPPLRANGSPFRPLPRADAIRMGATNGYVVIHNLLPPYWRKAQGVVCLADVPPEWNSLAGDPYLSVQVEIS
ncbi:MAG: hypothetical protein ACYDAG_12670 [Chloroflexota bacterium]